MHKKLHTKNLLSSNQKVKPCPVDKNWSKNMILYNYYRLIYTYIKSRKNQTIKLYTINILTYHLTYPEVEKEKARRFQMVIMGLRE